MPLWRTDDFAAAAMAAESRRPGFKILSRQSIARGDATSALEIANVLGVGPAGKSRKVFVIAGHRGFAVNAETYLDAWPSFEAAFDRVISSFKIAPHCRARDREMTLPAKFVIDLDRGAAAELTISGTADDDGLARRIVESLKTTTAKSCYWPDLERLLKGGDAAHPTFHDSAGRRVR